MYAVIICFAIMIAIIGPIIMTEFMPQSPEWCPILSNSIDDPYNTNTILYNNSDHKKNPCLYMLLLFIILLNINDSSFHCIRLISRNIMINNDIYDLTFMILFILDSLLAKTKMMQSSFACNTTGPKNATR